MGVYYGPDAVFLSVMASLFLFFGGAFSGWGVAACGAKKGRAVLDGRDLFAGVATAIGGVALFIAAGCTNYALPLAMPVAAFFVPAFVAIVWSDLYYKAKVPMWINVADELANHGEAIIQILDADGDGVVSRLDLKTRRPVALSKGVSSDLLNQLANSMNDYGHNVGSDGSSCYVLGARDVALAPARLRDSYQGWAEVYIHSPITHAE